MDPVSLPATEQARLVQSGALKARAVAEAYALRVEAHAKALNTHLHFDQAQALADADAVDRRIAKGEQLPLAGVTVAVKDNICTKGVPTTAGSKILEGFRPPYDAHVVERLRDAGAVLFGKTNLDEFAMGSSNENSAYGPVKNPYDRARVPGGSSGGSAAAVAARLCSVALGSDTGGSIRQPAAFCGVVGLKPTYGLVSRYGLLAYGSSLDAIGPLARNVADAALVLRVIAGKDERDSTSLETRSLPVPSRPLRIGVVKELMGKGNDDATRTSVEAALKDLVKAGCELREVSLPYLDYSIAAYYLIATAEASANLARYDGVRYGFRYSEPGQSLKQLYRETRSRGFGREVKQRIMLGTFALSSGYYDAYYAKANRARQLIARDFARAFEDVDLLASPTSPFTAFKLGEKADDPLAMYLADIGTLAANLAGVPGISLPCGADGAGLPVGLQLMAPQFAEKTLLEGAARYEQAGRWHERLAPRL